MAVWVPSNVVRLERWLRGLNPLDPMSCGVAVDSWKRRKERRNGVRLIAVKCTPLLSPDTQQQADVSEVLKEDEGVETICEPCVGRGWLLCNFCDGQKTNVKAANNRIYRRCPNCKAVGYVLCSECKVFKCVTYPDYSDGEL